MASSLGVLKSNVSASNMVDSWEEGSSVFCTLPVLSLLFFLLGGIEEE